MIRTRNVFAGVLFALAAFATVEGRAADPSFERGAEFIRNELRAATSGLRALAVAAHPDDEDGATLSFLRHAGVETHICFCTRRRGWAERGWPRNGRSTGRDAHRKKSKKPVRFSAQNRGS